MIDFEIFFDHFGAIWSKVDHFVKISGLTKDSSLEMMRYFGFAKVYSREIDESFLHSRKFIPAKKNFFFFFFFFFYSSIRES